MYDIHCTTQERDDMYSRLVALDLPLVIPVVDDLQNVQQRWLSGHMTNFDYLMKLNKLAGRSFNDLMQYPIYPFILAGYDKEALDLTNPASYRYVWRGLSRKYKQLMK